MIELVQNISFEDARNTAAYAGMSVLPVVSAVAGYDYFRKPQTAEAGIAGADADILNAVTHINKGRIRAHAKRWGSAVLVGAGLTSLAVNGLKPVITETITQDNAAVLLVIDQSNSMNFTEDMGGVGSRSDSVRDAVVETAAGLADSIRVGAIVFGEDSQTVSALTKDKQAFNKSLAEGSIDPNGGNLVGALTDADNIFAGRDDIVSENMIVITDGTLEASTEIAPMLNQAVEDGVNISVIVTGTEDASYRRTEFEAEATPSGATAAPFEKVEGITVARAVNKDEVAKAMTENIRKHTTSKERRPARIFTWLGSALLGLGLTEIMRQKLGKRI